jgi:hypothetical protein
MWRRGPWAEPGIAIRGALRAAPPERAGGVLRKRPEVPRSRRRWRWRSSSSAVLEAQRAGVDIVMGALWWGRCSFSASAGSVCAHRAGFCARRGRWGNRGRAVTACRAEGLARACWPQAGEGLLATGWRGLVGHRLARACWPQAGEGLLATGWRGLVGHRLARACWPQAGEGLLATGWRGLVGHRLARVCWPQAGEGLLATGWRGLVGHRLARAAGRRLGGSGREGALRLQ